MKFVTSITYNPTLSGKVTRWGCFFDAERSPLLRSSPNPKKIFGEEETHKNKSDSTSLNNNKHARHKDLSRGSGTPQRSSYVLVVEVTT